MLERSISACVPSANLSRGVDVGGRETKERKSDDPGEDCMVVALESIRTPDAELRLSRSITLILQRAAAQDELEAKSGQGGERLTEGG